MSKRALLIILIVGIISCSKHSPCDDLVGGVYQFPELPENHGMSHDEIYQFWDLPADIGECISTEGLIETCLNYPELRLIMAGSNPQSGYDKLVKARFRGIRELETRPDRGTRLLKRYLTIDPLGYNPNWELVDIGHYLFSIYNLEIIFSQQANLEPLTNHEIIKLLETAISIYEKKKSDLNHGLFGLECTTTLLGRLMLQKEYEPFINAYEENYWVRELIKYYGPTSLEITELVVTFSENFLNQLKNY